MWLFGWSQNKEVPNDGNNSTEPKTTATTGTAKKRKASNIPRPKRAKKKRGRPRRLQLPSPQFGPQTLRRASKRGNVGSRGKSSRTGTQRATRRKQNWLGLSLRQDLPKQRGTTTTKKRHSAKSDWLFTRVAKALASSRIHEILNAKDVKSAVALAIGRKRRKRRHGKLTPALKSPVQRPVTLMKNALHIAKAAWATKPKFRTKRMRKSR
ncbi:hypothetical protein RRG08_024110 [Elysia crispata]|uniref:Uncharacterized protein n=1 Tax=Elysia crispata TaxID=231223 RepID=A0AAE1BBE8_9GAST|nr:hypothetical protein RRG08_024110 [Elysia crispata]